MAAAADKVNQQKGAWSLSADAANKQGRRSLAATADKVDQTDTAAALPYSLQIV